MLNAKGEPSAYNVRLGVTDGTSTEIMVRPDGPAAQAVVEGATVVTGVTAATTPARGSGPRMSF